MESSFDQKSSDRSRRYTVLIFLAVFIIGTVPALSGRSGSVAAQMDSTMLGVAGSYGDPVFIKFEEITQVRLADAVAFGRMLEGEEKKNTLSGLYENDAFGTYTLHVYQDSPPYLVVSYGDGGTLVVNLKTAKQTRELYDSLTEQTASSRF